MAVPVTELQDGDKDTIAEYGQLEAMQIWQLFLSKKFGMYEIDRNTAVRETVSCIVLEAAEALAPFLNATKPWKEQTVDFAEVDEEVIDILHFVLAYFNLRGFNSKDVLERYRAKNLHNLTRVKKVQNVTEATENSM